MNKDMRQLIALLLVSLCGAAPRQQTSFVNECADIIAIRQSVEEYVREVKRRCPRSSQEYMAVEDSYSRAYESYESFINALSSNAVSGTRANEADLAVGTFIQECRTTLHIDHLTHLEEPRYGDFAPTFSEVASRQSKSSRSDWIRTIQTQLMWRSWDRIR